MSSGSMAARQSLDKHDMQPTIYLDNHATTQVDPRVVEAMLPYFSEQFGNASSRSHALGMTAKSAVEASRLKLASLLGCSPREVLFTSGATESNNIAILGIAKAFGRNPGHIITSAIEHPAVLDPLAQLKKNGWRITTLAIGRDGIIEASAIEDAIESDTKLVTIMFANNEIGTLQPIAEIAKVCQQKGVLFHTDAAQAVGKVEINFANMGLDLLSLSSHKFYGPKGVGALIIRQSRPKVPIEPLYYGGGQERGLRPGTLAVPLIVGIGEAAHLCEQELATGELKRVSALRDRLLSLLNDRLDGVHVNGSQDRRHPGNLNISFDGVEAAALMVSLPNIAISSGSACSSESLKPSHVLRAIGIEPERAHRSIRFGLGRFTTQEQIELVATLVSEKVEHLRELSEKYGV